MDKSKVSNLFRVLIFLLFLCLLGGCEDRFTDISSSAFKVKWDDSIKHTALSWWYLGEKEGYYYILEKWPLEQHGYRINKEHIVINLDHPKKFTLTESDWINLKKEHIDFK